MRAALGDAAAISLPQTARKQSSATQKSSVQTERQDALRRFIWEQDASVLAERLWSWAERDRVCMADLKIWASSSKAVDDPKALRAAIDAVLPRRNGYLDWRRSNDYARQGSAVMELLRPWVQRDAATARELCEHALRRLFKVAEQSDDSLGGIGGLIQDLMGLLIETLRTAAPPASWIDRWFKLMDADPWGLWNEPAVLEAAGPEAQARYAERACQDWHKWRQRPRKTTSRRSSSFLTSDDDLERDLLRRRYLEVLARQDDPRALLDAMIESVETAAEYCDVVAFCEARNWHREALQWAQSAARLHPATHVARMRYCAAMNATAGMRKRWPSVANAWNITLAPCNTWRYFGPQKRETRSRSLSGRAVRMGGTTRTGETQACVGTTSAY